ncbi:DNA polymerase lambda isoform X3 [Magnolia sinica]|uniref:DNA polymerase lambda isoform X3 n=1 Tax=Magnolia sinica TaxID=86752 RepID=UPI00265B20C3|nr:DNA polymerase lambda isoform X3 [Magnolia sinica]
MAPKKAKKKEACSDRQGMFSGMVVYLIDNGVQSRRLQIWKQRLMQMGAAVEDRLSKRVTHIFAMNSNALLQHVGCERLRRFKGRVLHYQWLEDSLKIGEKEPEDSYHLAVELEGANESAQSLEMCSESARGNRSDNELSPCKKTRISDDLEVTRAGESAEDKEPGDIGWDYLAAPEYRMIDMNSGDEAPTIASGYTDPSSHHNSDADESSTSVLDAGSNESSLYSAPDLNRNMTEIFGKLINIYRALGDDRRSFSYYKVIPVIEKLPFKIESVDQVKHLPAIGKSMQDHIQEILTTGKLSKLEHFERDEKVRTITLFGEVWGIGPATALKLYEKGHRTLDDLKKEDSLTNAQRLGLKYFDDIKKRIPRHEKAGQDVLPGVSIVCGGSYRRGKATCGDLDIVITHPDGKSHRGFLPKYVQYLKDVKFLREDLIFSTHSMQGTDSGVDTYFGLCTYPGREQRHRIDLKVYPRDIYAFGLIAWTGNDVLNRRLRLLAESKGYKLDDTGLYLATQSSAGKKGVKSSTSLSCKTEREVFDVLGFPWLEPHERNL